MRQEFLKRYEVNQKVRKIFFIVFCTIVCIFIFTACTNACEHSFGAYQADESYHWREYSCEHTAPSNKDLHTDGDANGSCDACGYEMKKSSIASKGLEYLLNDEGTKYAVNSIGSCTDKDIVIPDTNNGIPVVGILRGAFEGNTEITSVVLPDSVIIVYENAFAECTALESITLGNELKEIGESAFLGCESLASIALPSGLEYIYGHAFNGCVSLREIEIPDSVTLVQEYAFANCTALESIAFSNQMSTIKPNTCYGCSALKEIRFGTSITTVRKDAFYGCRDLEYLYIPKNITSINSAFAGCQSLLRMEFEETDNWKWASPRGFFNSVNVNDPKKNAENMKGLYSGSSWLRETEV